VGKILRVKNFVKLAGDMRKQGDDKWKIRVHDKEDDSINGTSIRKELHC